MRLKLAVNGMFEHVSNVRLGFKYFHKWGTAHILLLYPYVF